MVWVTESFSIFFAGCSFQNFLHVLSGQEKLQKGWLNSRKVSSFSGAGVCVCVEEQQGECFNPMCVHLLSSLLPPPWTAHRLWHRLFAPYSSHVYSSSALQKHWCAPPTFFYFPSAEFKTGRLLKTEIVYTSPFWLLDKISFSLLSFCVFTALPFGCTSVAPLPGVLPL